MVGFVDVLFVGLGFMDKALTHHLFVWGLDVRTALNSGVFILVEINRKQILGILYGCL